MKEKEKIVGKVQFKLDDGTITKPVKAEFKDLRPNTEGCDGYCRSYCCNANIDLDMGLCFECHDHSDTACSHCENQCEDMRTV